MTLTDLSALSVPAVLKCMCIDGPLKGKLIEMVGRDSYNYRLGLGEVNHNAVCGVVTYRREQLAYRNEWTRTFYDVLVSGNLTASKALNHVRAQLTKSQDYCARCDNNRTVCCFDDENPLGIKACPDCTTKGTRP